MTPTWKDRVRAEYREETRRYFEQLTAEETADAEQDLRRAFADRQRDRIALKAADNEITDLRAALAAAVRYRTAWQSARRRARVHHGTGLCLTCHPDTEHPTTTEEPQTR